MMNSSVLAALKIPLLLLAFTPLVFYGGTLFPFIFPKAVFMRVMLAVFWAGLAAFLLLKGRRSGISGSGLKHPVFIAAAVYSVLMALSTVLAANPYRAFWGDVERGEGLSGFLFFFGFFAAALLLFNRTDWKRFFVFTLIPAAMLFADQLVIFLAKRSLFLKVSPAEFESGRVLGSLVGNPTFLSAFYIFAIFAAAALLAGRVSARAGARDYVEISKRAGLAVAMLAAAAGIFIGGTRGAILGLAAGAVAVAAFVALQRSFPKTARRLALAGMAVAILFVAVFAATRHAALWKGVPGLYKIAAISSEDPTLRTRLIAAGIGLDAANPKNEGVLRALLGWGPENFSVAYQKYFDPRYFRYEALWFDRAHNKLFDVLVMNGLAGLIAYFSIWFFVFRAILRRAPRSSAADEARNNAEPPAGPREDGRWESAALLFFAVAYFVQNLFAFENISIYIPFFAFLAYAAHLDADNGRLPAGTKQSRAGSVGAGRGAPVLAVFAGAMAIFFAAILAVTLMALGQMRAYLPPLLAGRADAMLSNFDKITRPYTYVQTELRSSFGQLMLANIAGADITAARPFLTRVAETMREAADRERTNARPFILVASIYETLGETQLAQEYRRKALELAPRRQDVLYTLALSEAMLGNSEVALDYGKRMLDADPEATISRIYYATILMLAQKAEAFDEATNLILTVFDGRQPFRAVRDEVDVARRIFEIYLAEFYRVRDQERFLETLRRFALFEERNEIAARFYSPRAKPSDRLPEIRRQIEAFTNEGWSAVQAGQ